MNMSFYTGAAGAGQFTKKLSVVSNNLANINNTGFKPKTAAFSELIHYNLNDSENAQTELQTGAGASVPGRILVQPVLLRPEKNMIMQLWSLMHFL